MHSYKKILDNKRCPKCGELIPWWKVLLYDWAWTYYPWNCSKCNTKIGYNRKKIEISRLTIFGVFVAFYILCTQIDAPPFNGIWSIVLGISIIIFGSFYVFAISATEIKENDDQ